MNGFQAKLDYADAIADYFLELGDNYIRGGDLVSGLRYNYIVATILCNQNRTLSSPRIDYNLRKVGAALAGCQKPRWTAPSEPGELCLHVLREALPAGGLTAMVTRWIENDRSGRRHSVALLSQKIPVPHSLTDAVEASGGRIFITTPATSIPQQAAWLRNLANSLANYVILHVHGSDIIWGTAFGTAGGPPVVLVNHAAHAFWVGASIADLVVNCRGSALESLWTAKFRGASRQATVPIPLLLPKSTTTPEPQVRSQAKIDIGLPGNAVVILTVGASFKFDAIGELDFVRVCESILHRLPGAFVLAVGFAGDERWRGASRRTAFRLLTLGTVSQSQLDNIHSATDIYIEGFPFGTTTSLLEAGLKGIPAVLAPALCPPPYGSDGVALDDTLDRPKTIEDYEEQIAYLGSDPIARASSGERLRKAIAEHHTGQAWNCYLEEALKSLPHEHLPANYIVPPRTPAEAHEYRCKVSETSGAKYAETLETALARALSIGLRPRLGATVRRACAYWRAVRVGTTIPLPLLVLFCNLLPLLPIVWAQNVFRFLGFLYRDSLFIRVRRKLSVLLGRRQPPPSRIRRLPEDC